MSRAIDRLIRRGTGGPVVLMLFLLSASFPVYGQDDWIEYKSGHLRIVGDADEDQARRIVAALEGLEAAKDQFFRPIGVRLLPPATLLLLDGGGDLRGTGLEDGNGSFYVGPDRSFAVLTEPASDASLEELLHNYFLATAERNVPNAPLWIKEGLAAFYRTTRWSDDGSRLETGLPIQDYLDPVRNERNRMGYARLREVASVSEAEGIFEAESWALTHFLMTREAGRGHDQTAELVRLMAFGEPFEEAVTDAFGIGFRTLLAEFDAYIEGRGTLPRLTLGIEPAVGEMTFVGDVPEIDAATAIGAALVAAGLASEAEDQLARAVAMDRSAFGPYIALAPMLMEQGRFDELRFGFDQALRRSDAPYLARYYYALSLIRQNEEPSPVQLARVRRDLETAIRLKPDFADAYHQLAASFLDTGEGADEAVRLLETALELSPENPDYLVTYSRFLIGQRRFDDAREVLVPLVDRSRNSETRDRAGEILRSIAGQSGGRGLVGEGFAEIRTSAGQSDQIVSEPAAPPPPATGIPAGGIQLTRVVRGEQQAGSLTLVDCREGLALTVEDGEGTYLFFTDSPERVEFSSNATANVGLEIRCGPQDPAPPVVVTFRPAAEGSEFLGVPVKVEFVEP